MGPGFDPETHIEDWSDDSSDMDDNMSNQEQDDQAILASLFASGGLALNDRSSQPLGSIGSQSLELDQQ